MEVREKGDSTQQKSKSVNQEVIEKGKTIFFALSVLYFFLRKLAYSLKNFLFFFFCMIIETVLGPEKNSLINKI